MLHILNTFFHFGKNGVVANVYTVFPKTLVLSHKYLLHFFSASNKKGWGGMCFIPPHYIIPIFPLCWMAIRGPDAKLWKQQHLAPWQIPQSVLLPAFKLCLGLLHGLAADGLSGLPCASGYQFWLTFDSEDFTHFYSFVNKGPSKCFMKPTLK